MTLADWQKFRQVFRSEISQSFATFTTWIKAICIPFRNDRNTRQQQNDNIFVNQNLLQGQDYYSEKKPTWIYHFTVSSLTIFLSLWTTILKFWISHDALVFFLGHLEMRVNKQSFHIASQLMFRPRLDQIWNKVHCKHNWLDLETEFMNHWHYDMLKNVGVKESFVIAFSFQMVIWCCAMGDRNSR